MKKKRTEAVASLLRDHPVLGQRVEVNDWEQARRVIQEVAQLRRHAMAIETDVYQSMRHICLAANRFLAPRRARMQVLLAGLQRFLAEEAGGQQKRRAPRAGQGATGKHPIPIHVSHPLTEKEP
ncbi:MAG: hypothetical protein H7837_08995 [Magnetococcus sp. MYC-9]